MAECPCYVSGMVVTIDRRYEQDACIKFAHTILKSVFALERDEEHWNALLSVHGFDAFELVFSHFRNQGSNFFQTCLSKLCSGKSSILSDIAIKCQF